MREGMGRPLGIALLAAVLLHGLGLTYAGLRQSRGGRAPEVARAPDDTPELLRFSRRAPQALALNTIPLPPPSLLPPPPANLLAPLPAERPANAPAAKGAGARVTTTVAPPPKPPKGRTPGGRTPRGQTPIASGAAAKPAAPTQAAALAALPAGLAAARQALEELRGAPAGEGKDTAALRGLWEQAEPVEGAGLEEGLELRRLAAAKAKELGLTAGERRSGRAEGVLLVGWLEGDQLWLLQAAG
ncbi:hypothetical protein NZK33_16105 [Cyanobium sp. FGCU-6]|nr:hypothetical protein [Cyanobium sp. FGCU6]